MNDINLNHFLRYFFWRNCFNFFEISAYL